MTHNLEDLTHKISKFNPQLEKKGGSVGFQVSNSPQLLHYVLIHEPPDVRFFPPMALGDFFVGFFSGSRGVFSETLQAEKALKKAEKMKDDRPEELDETT